jgi:EF hand domain-containing protein
MKLAKTILSACAFGLAASAFAVDYPEERGVVPSVIPPSPDESGVVNNVPRWRDVPSNQAAPLSSALDETGPAEIAAGDRSVDSYFSRYDANHDGVVSWEEAQRDPDLARVFSRADANGDGVLTRAEFEDAAVLAVSESQGARGG